MSRKMKCKKCGMIVESKYKHDLQKCKCGNFIDGGDAYTRVGGNLEDIIVLPKENKKQ